MKMYFTLTSFDFKWTLNDVASVVRFCGTTEFAPGIWAGVELDTADGRNDGIVKGMR